MLAYLDRQVRDDLAKPAKLTGQDARHSSGARWGSRGVRERGYALEKGARQRRRSTELL